MSYTTYGPLQNLIVPGNASALITTIQSNASWIWPAEDTALYPPPQAPGNVQRVFRRTWTNSSPKTRSTKETTILITADNSFELFVNGVLVHPRSEAHDWKKPLLFSVPVTGDKITYAVRAVNKYSDFGAPASSPAGLRAAVRISFALTDDSKWPTPEMFHTGSGDTWVSSRVYGSRWEQPAYDDARWTPAIAMPESVNGSLVWGELEAPDVLRVATSIPQAAGTGALTATFTVTVTSTVSAWEQPTGSARAPFQTLGVTTLSNIQLAGMVVGIVVGAALLGAWVTYMFMRKRKVVAKVQSFSPAQRVTGPRFRRDADTVASSSMYQ